jgi:outer membrane immunogenic protein
MGRKLFAIAVAGMKGLAGASRSATATPAEANRVLEKLAALEARMATLGSENHDLRRRLARGPSRPVPAALSGPIAAQTADLAPLRMPTKAPVMAQASGNWTGF